MTHNATAGDDSDLLRRAREFDPQALGQIYDAYFERLYRYAYRFVDSPEAAQDIASEALRRFLEALRDRRGPNRHLAAWLYRVARNLAVDAHRRAAPGGTVSLDPELDRASDADTEAAAELRIARAQMRDALARYPDLAADLGPLLDAWSAFMAYGQAPAPAEDQIARRREFLRTAQQYGDEAVSRSPFERLFNRTRGAFTPRQERPVLLLIFARIAAAVVLTLGLAGGAGLTAQASLPDSPLYGFKLWVEDAQLLMAPAAEGRTSQSSTPTPRSAQRATATPHATTHPQSNATPRHTASPQREGTPNAVATPAVTRRAKTCCQHILITERVMPGVAEGEILTTTVKIGFSGAESDAADNIAAAASIVCDMAGSAKQVSAEEAMPGDALTYTIRLDLVQRQGQPNRERTVALTDVLPASHQARFLGWTGDVTGTRDGQMLQ